MRPVAAGQVQGGAGLQGAIGPPQTCDHMVRLFREINKLCLSLDVDARPRQVIDEQSFVIVLRKDQRVRKWAETGAPIDADPGEAPSRAANVRQAGHCRIGCLPSPRPGRFDYGDHLTVGPNVVTGRNAVLKAGESLTLPVTPSW
jgi:hypothetical protein